MSMPTVMTAHDFGFGVVVTYDAGAEREFNLVNAMITGMMMAREAHRITSLSYIKLPSGRLVRWV